MMYLSQDFELEELEVGAADALSRYLNQRKVYDAAWGNAHSEFSRLRDSLEAISRHDKSEYNTVCIAALIRSVLSRFDSPSTCDLKYAVEKWGKYKTRKGKSRTKTPPVIKKILQTLTTEQGDERAN